VAVHVFGLVDVMEMITSLQVKMNVNRYVLSLKEGTLAFYQELLVLVKGTTLHGIMIHKEKCAYNSSTVDALEIITDSLLENFAIIIASSLTELVRIFNYIAI